MRLTMNRALGLVTMTFALATVGPSPARAQLGITPSNQRVLILGPVAERFPQDSLLAVRLGDAVRERFDNKERLRLRVTPKPSICETLTASGFHCDVALSNDDAKRLAATLRSDAYITGTLTRNSRPTLHLHMVDLTRSGLAGWVVVPLDTALKVPDMANVVVDSLDAQLRVAEDARDCLDRVNRSDFKGAREKADRVFKVYPNQPSAALCLSRLFEATRQPPDSQIFALQKAVRGDSLNARAWEQLSRAYEDKGDVANAAQASTNQLAATPNDLTLRQRVAAGWIIQKQYQRAVDIIDVGLQTNPLDLISLKLKQQACVDGELWRCAVSALGDLFEVDSSLANDSIFYAKIIGAAQAINDSASMLKWSGQAVKHIPGSVSLWRARAAALKGAGMKDSATRAYVRVVQLDSTDGGSMLAAAQGISEAMVIDSLTPLDTAALRRVDGYLTRASAILKDPQSRGIIGLLYASPGLKMAQLSGREALSDSLLLKALSYGLPTVYSQQANFFLGVHYFKAVAPPAGLAGQIQALGTHTPPRAPTAEESARGCQMIIQEVDLLAKARQSLTLGRFGAMAAPATTMLNYLGQMEQQVTPFKRFFKCP